MQGKFVGIRVLWYGEAAKGVIGCFKKVMKVKHQRAILWIDSNALFAGNAQQILMPMALCVWNSSARIVIKS